MLKNRRFVAAIWLVLSFAGIVQFGRHVRAVDAVGLIISGVMAGVGICMLKRDLGSGLK